MKILFDHNVPKKLRRWLTGHDVRTAREMTWEKLENGHLLAAAEAAGFEPVLTCDQSLSYQQNLKSRKLALVVLGTNNWTALTPSLQAIANAIEAATPGCFQRIDPA